jgi:predicted transcriptional regulator
MKFAMSTTTIRLDDVLRERLTTAAALLGKTPHAFILEAIAQTVEQVEVDADFHRLAAERWAELRETGQTVAWDAAKAYLEARAQGTQMPKPAPSKPKA